MTIAQLEKKFAEFNYMYFDGLLPDVIIKYCNSKGYVGLFSCPKPNSKSTRCTIKITKYYEMPDQAIEETLIHEMIHLWQYINGYYDSHGTSFKDMMSKINAIGRHNITITDKQVYDASIYSGINDKIWHILVFKTSAYCKAIMKCENKEKAYKFYKGLQKYKMEMDIKCFSIKGSQYVSKLKTSRSSYNAYMVTDSVLNSDILPKCITEYVFN